MISPLRLLLGARGLRNFGDGFVAVLLPVYLKALCFSPLEVGALAGTALFGSALLTLAVGVLGVRYDHRLLLISSAGLMTATGVALSIVDSCALLLVCPAARRGIRWLSQSFRRQRQLLCACRTCRADVQAADAERTKPFARYSLVGGLEEELARGAGKGRQQLDQIARRAFERVPPGRKQIEGERHRREQVCGQPFLVNQRADRQPRAGRYGQSRA
jgi:hypothetical protein